MEETRFRLPTAGFEVLRRILSAYASAGMKGPTKLEDVAKRAAMSKPAVSANHAFLESVGVLDGGRQKALTSLGRSLAVSAQHPGSIESRNAWAELAEESEHLKRVVDAVRIRRGMTGDALATHIIVTASAPKNSGTMTGARAVIDLLVEAGKLEERDGTFIPVISEEIREAAASTEPVGVTESVRVIHRTASRASQPHLSIHLHIDAEVAKSEQALTRIEAMLKSLIRIED